jgi:hypothetical protein
MKFDLDQYLNHSGKQQAEAGASRSGNIDGQDTNSGLCNECNLLLHEEPDPASDSERHPVIVTIPAPSTAFGEYAALDDTGYDPAIVVKELNDILGLASRSEPVSGDLPSCTLGESFDNIVKVQSTTNSDRATVITLNACDGRVTIADKETGVVGLSAHMSSSKAELELGQESIDQSKGKNGHISVRSQAGLSVALIDSNRFALVPQGDYQKRYVVADVTTPSLSIGRGAERNVSIESGIDRDAVSLGRQSSGHRPIELVSKIDYRYLKMRYPSGSMGLVLGCGDLGCALNMYGAGGMSLSKDKLVFYNQDGSDVVTIDGKAGDIVLNGGDFAELFYSKTPLPPGSVVAYSRGGVVLASKRTAKRAVGVVAGAGGLRPGVTLRGETVEKGGLTVAVSVAGRVYCRANLDGGVIRCGDLVTSSGRPGEVMRAGDRTDRASIVGKALGPMRKKDGLVLAMLKSC